MTLALSGASSGRRSNRLCCLILPNPQTTMRTNFRRLAPALSLAWLTTLTASAQPVYSVLYSFPNLTLDSGTPPISYEWLRSSTNLPRQTAATLLFTNLGLDAAGNYQVVVSNPWGSQTSGVATLTVGYLPTMTNSGATVPVRLGQALTLRLKAASGTAPLGYLWLKNSAILPGQTTYKLVFPSIVATNAGDYQLVATNLFGSATSGVYAVTIGSPPVITVQPSNEAVAVGQTATCAVTATGPQLNYLWFKTNALLGATNATLVLSNIGIQAAGGYRVAVTNLWGEVTSSVAVLSVGHPPAITVQPQGGTITVGSKFTFSVAASGTRPLFYQWFKGNTALAGDTQSSFTLAKAAATDSGTYTVVVTNTWGAVTSAPAVLNVGLTPTITTPPQNQVVIEGQTATFSVTASGTAPLGYQWLKEGEPLAGYTANPLSWSGVLTNQAGDYQVVVSNAWGQATSTIALLQVVQYQVITLAGAAGSAGGLDGTGSAARFHWPHGLAVDNYTNVYVADEGNDAIRKVTGQGVVTTYAGALGVVGSNNGTSSDARFDEPCGVAEDARTNLYVADTLNELLRKVSRTLAVTTLAGKAGVSGTNNGAGNAARFNGPFGVAVDKNGTVYVADATNQAIRKVTASGSVSTLAGRLGVSGSADGTGTAARFLFPSGVAVDSAFNVYVADTGNSTIRKVTRGGVVTTLAGSAGHTGSDDATGAAARFNWPSAIAVDFSGNLYVADTDNHTIRQITPSGQVTTLAGVAGTAGSSNGIGYYQGYPASPSIAAMFNQPMGVAVDANGNIYVGDTENDTIRVIIPVIVPDP